MLVAQDHLTKYCWLRPLNSKTAAEVAYEILHIMLDIGPPAILHSDRGKEFVNKIIEELSSLWPEMKFVRGKPRHPQSQGSVERCNQTVKEMLATWMADNKSSKWSEGSVWFVKISCINQLPGMRFVQFAKNCRVHEGIGRSPYSALFGSKPRYGLVEMYPPGILNGINTEEELEDLDLSLQPEQTPSQTSQTDSLADELSQEDSQMEPMDESNLDETLNQPSSSALITCCVICNMGSPSHECVQV